MHSVVFPYDTKDSYVLRFNKFYLSSCEFWIFRCKKQLFGHTACDWSIATSGDVAAERACLGLDRLLQRALVSPTSGCSAIQN